MKITREKEDIKRRTDGILTEVCESRVVNHCIATT